MLYLKSPDQCLLPSWNRAVCLVTQSCPTLCDHMYCSWPGSSVHGIFQTRILVWLAVPSSRGSSQIRDQTQVSCIAGRFFTSWATMEAPEILLISISICHLVLAPLVREDWCWSWNSNTLATRCEELTHLKRPWCWERSKAGGEGDDRGWDGQMASLTQWTWVWVNSGSWWWTGRPGVLWFMGSQRVGHDWATELNWTEDINIYKSIIWI